VALAWARRPDWNPQAGPWAPVLLELWPKVLESLDLEPQAWAVSQALLLQGQNGKVLLWMAYQTEA
jgi:hypothetical protein